jgi:hypothetical protein
MAPLINSSNCAAGSGLIECVLAPPRGFALWQLGRHRQVVELALSDEERRIVDSDAALHAR